MIDTIFHTEESIQRLDCTNACKNKFCVQAYFFYTNMFILLYYIQPKHLSIRTFNMHIDMLQLQLQYVTKSNKQRPVLLLLYCFALFSFNICVTTLRILSKYISNEREDAQSHYTLSYKNRDLLFLGNDVYCGKLYMALISLCGDVNVNRDNLSKTYKK